MEWILTAALLPLLVCGAMCVGGALLAALGLRRATRHASCRPTVETHSPPPKEVVKS